MLLKSRFLVICMLMLFVLPLASASQNAVFSDIKKMVVSTGIPDENGDIVLANRVTTELGDTIYMIGFVSGKIGVAKAENNNIILVEYNPAEDVYTAGLYVNRRCVERRVVPEHQAVAFAMDVFSHFRIKN
jgi:hypothetical protein